jgi:hypothetical protein
MWLSFLEINAVISIVISGTAHQIDDMAEVDVEERAKCKVFLLQQPEGTMAGWTSRKHLKKNVRVIKTLKTQNP